MNFLQDKSFLLKLNQFKVKKYLAQISVLDFTTEQEITTFEGYVVSGNLNVATNSPTRRTGSLSVRFAPNTYKITDVKNLIAINKKVKISIGVLNPFYNTEEYNQYGRELWFPQGIFFITSASISYNTSSSSVSMNFIDKMGKLNGTCGGTLPASVSFHESIYINDQGEQIIEYPLIRDIIFEAVHHYGGEDPSRIIIEDIPEVGRQIVGYINEYPIRFKRNSGEEQSKTGVDFYINADPVIEGYNEVYYRGDTIGYLETPLTYPGELIQKAGTSVTAMLDNCVKVLGNYEYFYDVDGNFHFRQIRNYYRTGVTQLNYDTTSDLQSLYFPYYTDYRFLNEFADSSLITQVSVNPKYENIKNDFVCWGTKNDKSNGASDARMVRYHLAIDKKPQDEGENSLCHAYIQKIVDSETKQTIRYQLGPVDNLNEGEEKGGEISPLQVNIRQIEAQFNWREELYRQALLAYGSSTRATYYDEELIAEWRNIFDPNNMEFKEAWETKFGEGTWTGYCVDAAAAPHKLRYWLDIIDESSAIGQYSVSKIGRRSKVIENNNIDEIFHLDPPDLVFVDVTLSEMEKAKRIEYYNSIGQDFAMISPSTMEYFTTQNSFGTCYEEIRSMLYNNLLYNTSINLTCIPIMYLDVNSVVRLNLPEVNINNDYIINSISLQIGASNTTMSLQLNEVITEV